MTHSTHDLAKYALQRLAQQDGKEPKAYVSALLLREAEKYVPDWWMAEAMLTPLAVSQAAHEMVDNGGDAVGFALDELVDYLGLGPMPSLKRKGHITKILRDQGFKHRLRTMHDGQRRWVWVGP